MTGAQSAVNNVLVVSEWLATENQEQSLFDAFKKLAKITLENEKGCKKYHVTRQIPHPHAKGESKYTILLVQEYVDVAAFDAHCKSKHVADFTKDHFENKDANMIKDWRCRVFSE